MTGVKCSIAFPVRPLRDSFPSEKCELESWINEPPRHRMVFKQWYGRRHGEERAVAKILVEQTQTRATSPTMKTY